MRVHVCVLHVECPHCLAMPGEPCHNSKPVLERRYSTTHHHVRLKSWELHGKPRGDGNRCAD